MDKCFIYPFCLEFSLPRFQVAIYFTSIRSLLKITFSWDLSWLLYGKLQHHSHFLFFFILIFFSISLNHLQVHHIIYILCILFIFYFFPLKHKLQEDSDLWLSGLLLYTSTQIFIFESEWLMYQINETEVMVFVIETPILFYRVFQEI